MDIIQINTEEISLLKDEEILFFMLAEAGAMGEPGAVNIISKGTDGAKIRHANYCFGGFYMHQLMERDTANP